MFFVLFHIYLHPLAVSTLDIYNRMAILVLLSFTFCYTLEHEKERGGEKEEVTERKREREREADRQKDRGGRGERGGGRRDREGNLGVR